MNEAPDLSNYYIIGVIVAILSLLLISFLSYLVSIKGWCGQFPDLIKGIIGFVIEHIIVGIIALWANAVSMVALNNMPYTPDKMSFAIIVAVIATFLALTTMKKFTTQYVTELEVSMMQATSLLVMHLFYFAVISYVSAFLFFKAYEAWIQYLINKSI